jgi:hypothetical protein
MAQHSESVSDIFRHAQTLRRESPGLTYKELKAKLLDKYQGTPFPAADRLTIPEQDARAPEEDWTAGLPLVLRGIQQQDWKDVVDGIVLSLEQTENFEKERNTQSSDTWHDRTVGISESLAKGVGKWMPSKLMALAERESKK